MASVVEGLCCTVFFDTLLSNRIPPYNMIAGHPDINCTFQVMSRCNQEYGAEAPEADECRRGARDAHLLQEDGCGSSAAYEAGKWTTLAECAPLVGVPPAHLPNFGCGPCQTG